MSDKPVFAKPSQPPMGSEPAVLERESQPLVDEKSAPLDLDSQPMTKFEQVQWLLEDAAIGRGEVQIKPKLTAVFESRVTDIHVFLKLGGNFSGLALLFAKAGYQTSEGTLRHYYATHKSKVDEREAQERIDKAKRVRVRRDPAPVAARRPPDPEKNTPSPSQPSPRRTAENPDRARRAGYDASETSAPRALPATPAGLSTGETASGAGSFSPDLSPASPVASQTPPAPNTAPAASAQVIEPTASESEDFDTIHGVARSFAEFRKAVASNLAKRSASVPFADGTVLFVPVRLHQKIAAGTIGSWAEYSKAAG